MLVLAAEQGTKEWHAARRGRITASQAHLALARPGGKGRTDYVRQLADALQGIPDFRDEGEPTPEWFLDGRYYESWSRGWYQWTRDVDVVEVGFVTHDEYTWLGSSPDGLIRPRGAVEVGATIQTEGVFETKYRKTLRTFHKHASLGETASVIAQAQTQMCVTGALWCDYTNYWRSQDNNELEKGHVQRIWRDDAYIDNTLLPAFVGLWREVQALLEAQRREYNRTRAR